ncbi:unnamed protein product [Amoebophrya sp. A25]|nr:unnamed protein product [Amoebophrya sp. A25]|eukprot:GSA25T00003275001.1
MQIVKSAHQSLIEDQDKAEAKREREEDLQLLLSSQQAQSTPRPSPQEQSKRKKKRRIFLHRDVERGNDLLVFGQTYGDTRAMLNFTRLAAWHRKHGKTTRPSSSRTAFSGRLHATKRGRVGVYDDIIGLMIAERKKQPKETDPTTGDLVEVDKGFSFYIDRLVGKGGQEVVDVDHASSTNTSPSYKNEPPPLRTREKRALADRILRRRVYLPGYLPEATRIYRDAVKDRKATSEKILWAYRPKKDAWHFRLGLGRNLTSLIGRNRRLMLYEKWYLPVSPVDGWTPNSNKVTEDRDEPSSYELRVGNSTLNIVEGQRQGSRRTTLLKRSVRLMQATSFQMGLNLRPNGGSGVLQWDLVRRKEVPVEDDELDNTRGKHKQVQLQHQQNLYYHSWTGAMNNTSPYYTGSKHWRRRHRQRCTLPRDMPTDVRTNVFYEYESKLFSPALGVV